MATYEEAMQALRNADAAGNTEDARKLAAIAQRLKSSRVEDKKEPESGFAQFRRQEREGFDKSPAPRPFLQELGRQAVGLPARYIAEGVSSIADPINKAANVAVRAMNPGMYFMDEGKDTFGTPSEVVGRRLTQAGLPQPETEKEKMVGEGSKLIAGSMVPMGGPKAATKLAEKAAEQVTSRPRLVDQAAEDVAKRGPVSQFLRDRAERFMHSALKPGTKYIKKAEGAIDTMLENGWNVTDKGLEQMRNRLDTLNAGIANQIEKAPDIIDKQKVVSRLYDVLEKVSKEATPQKSIAAVEKVWQEFMEHPIFTGKGIPIKEAQEMKQATYRSMAGYYGAQLVPAEKQAQIALARGLKEEIASAIPKIAPMNAEESRLLSALPILERRVLHSGNKNLTGFGALMLLHPTEFAVWMADRSELFKSIVANMMNRGSKLQAPSLRGITPSMGISAVAQGGVPQVGERPQQQQ